jgi:hypothetical protein
MILGVLPGLYSLNAFHPIDYVVAFPALLFTLFLPSLIGVAFSPNSSHVPVAEALGYSGRIRYLPVSIFLCLLVLEVSLAWLLLELLSHMGHMP